MKREDGSGEQSCVTAVRVRNDVVQDHDSSCGSPRSASTARFGTTIRRPSRTDTRSPRLTSSYACVREIARICAASSTVQTIRSTRGFDPFAWNTFGTRVFTGTKYVRCCPRDALGWNFQHKRHAQARRGRPLTRHRQGKAPRISRDFATRPTGSANHCENTTRPMLCLLPPRSRMRGSA